MSLKFTKIDNKYVVEVIYNIMDNNDTKTHKVIIDQKVFVDHTGSIKTLDDIFDCINGRLVVLEQNKPQVSPTYNIFKINELVEEAITELN